MREEPVLEYAGADAAAHAYAQHASIAATDARAYSSADSAAHAFACHPAWRSHRHACLRADA